MYILGIHTSHDASACLLKDGIIRVAIEKERLSRHKHDWGNNGLQDVVEYCLQAEGISLTDIVYIVSNDINNIFSEPIFSKTEHQISHHLAHAWAVVGLSSFDECAVMIIDGEGSKVVEVADNERNVCNHKIDFFAEKESCYHYVNNNLIPLKKWTSGRGGDSKFSGTDAIGSPYWLLSQMFFNKEHQESKIMGLSSYGKPEERYRGIYQLTEGGSVNIDEQWIFDFKEFPQSQLDSYFDRYANLAASIQTGLEDSLLHKAAWLKKETESKNLCFAGGVALNCVANSKLYEQKIFDQIFVPFGAGDSSIAIGCAYYGWHVLAQQKKRKQIVTPYLGKVYSDREIIPSLTLYSNHSFIKYEERKDYVQQAAKELSKGAIVAWFQGKSEFGPRALGNRSLLANPSLPDIRELINRKVKFREVFRPFAPAVLEDLSPNWFDQIVPDSYFMQFIASVKKDCRDKLPAITHIDGTARIQLVNEKYNRIFYQLLQAFYQHSSIPVLLNTSFNIQEPIVETPDDALETFLTSSIDALYINHFRVESLVQPVTAKEELNGKSTFLIYHKSFQLRYQSPDFYSLQILPGLEKVFRFGSYYQVSNFAEQKISESLFLFLRDKRKEHPFSENLSSAEAVQLYNCFDEFKKTIIEQRIISAVQYKTEL